MCFLVVHTEAAVSSTLWTPFQANDNTQQRLLFLLVSVLWRVLASFWRWYIDGDISMLDYVWCWWWYVDVDGWCLMLNRWRTWAFWRTSLRRCTPSGWWQRATSTSSRPSPCHSRRTGWGQVVDWFMINSLIGWCADWLIGWFVSWFVDWLSGEWLIGLLIDWLIGLLVDWLIGWLVVWSVDWLIGWLIACLLDWLVGWLVDRLVDWLVR